MGKNLPPQEVPVGVCDLLLYIFSGDFQIVGGHGSPELTGSLGVAGDFLTGAVGADLGEVQLLQLVAVSDFHISGDLGAVGSGFPVDSDLAAVGILDDHIMVRNDAAADVADAVLVAVLAPVLVDELLAADQAVTPVGGAIRDPAAQLVAMGHIAQIDIAGIVTVIIESPLCFVAIRDRNRGGVGPMSLR